MPVLVGILVIVGIPILLMIPFLGPIVYDLRKSQYQKKANQDAYLESMGRLHRR